MTMTTGLETQRDNNATSPLRPPPRTPPPLDEPTTWQQCHVTQQGMVRPHTTFSAPNDDHHIPSRRNHHTTLTHTTTLHPTGLETTRLEPQVFFNSLFLTLLTTNGFFIQLQPRPRHCQWRQHERRQGARCRGRRQ